MPNNTVEKNINKGKVYLIGAGPGDEGLFTLKGSECLKNADVVVYDRLVSKAILDFIPENAVKINVGKNTKNHPVPQDEINRILLEEALDGKVVVRLKGGDPFVFGRGGEELELLAENGVDFEVIPGVTSAIAAASYAGIPITHRDYCSSLHIITGHIQKNGPLQVDYNALAKLRGTLIFLMSVASIGEISKGLMNEGMDREIPVAAVENGTLSHQRKIVATLETIEQVAKNNNLKSPTVFIVGKVCNLSEKFDWFSKKPLKGKNVLITRPAKTAGRLSKLLRDEGAQATEYPCIFTKPLDFEAEINDLSWILFTSEAGVDSFFTGLKAKGVDSRYLYGKKVGAIGSQTAKSLESHGILADFIPTVYDGEHFAKELIISNKFKKGEKIGLFRAKEGSKDITRVLFENNINFVDVPIYETFYENNKFINIKNYDFLTFTSASCVEGFVKSMEENSDFTDTKAICIGQTTKAAAEAFGFKTLISNKATLLSMVDKIKEDSNDK